ncbi:MAG TPA: dienelactone hydrolase family protein [Longimicrobium sp.]|nr:dienelactone hydrolase family protein [Longimicrobium sp.]
MTATAGCRTLTLIDPPTGTPFPALVLYPSTAPERPVRMGPYELEVAMGGPVADGAHPLVAVSHGSGGSHLTHRGVAAHLARAGFVVIVPEHPRNNRNNNELAGTHTLLADRPRQLSLAISAAYEDAALGPLLVPDAVAVIGHSLGGYTALALAGGRPVAAEHETPDRQIHPVPVTPDVRVKALVLLAPATPWYMVPGALAAVRVPILMISGEKDESAPLWHAAVVTRGVSAQAPVEHRIVPNAGHYSFLTPFPGAMTNPGFPPSQDPPGFDRAAFHREMYPEIEAFLRRVLRVRPAAG